MVDPLLFVFIKERHRRHSPCVPPKMKRGELEMNRSEQPAGSSSETETTVQGVEARKRKRNKNFIGHSPCVSLKTKRGIIEKNGSMQRAGSSSETETTAQGVEARKRKRNKNFIGHSPCVSLKTKRGIIEKNGSMQRAGSSSETETTAQGVEARKRKRNKNFIGHSPCVSLKTKRGIIEKNGSMQRAGSSSETETTAQGVEARKRKRNKNFIGHFPRKRKRGIIKKNENEQPEVTSMTSDQAAVTGNSSGKGPSEFVETEDQRSLRKYGESYVKLLLSIKNVEKGKKEAIEKLLTERVQNYVKFNDRQESNFLKALKSFTDHLIESYGVNLVTFAVGSVIIILECPTLESLEHLWMDYFAGHLDKTAERYLVNDEMKRELNLETICFTITIEEENYLNCRKAFEELPKTCLESTVASGQAVEAGHSGEQGPSAIVETEDDHSLKKYGGTSSELEIAVQAVGARKLEQNKDFRGLSPLVPSKTEGEKTESEQPAELYVKFVISTKNLENEKEETMEKCLSQTVQNYSKSDDHPRANYAQALKSSTDHVITTLGVNLLTAAKDSVIIVLECPTLESLELLWNDYLAGHLDKVAERYLVTDETKKELNSKTIFLKTYMEEENYLNCKKAFEELPKTYLGTSSEREITAQIVEARELKGKKNFTGRSPRAPLKRKLGAVKPEALTSLPSKVIEGIRQVYQKREGVLVPVPWCEDFSFQIEDIFTRLRVVAKENTGPIVTSKEVTSMTSIFTPHKGCKPPLIVLIEGEPGMGKTTYCRKLVCDWASKQCREWDESFPRIDVPLLLKCCGIKSTIWDAIDDQILPEEIETEEKEKFFHFLKTNPAKVLLVLDGLDEADAQTLEMCFNLIQRKQLPGCYIVLTSRHEAGKKVKPYTDMLLKILGFTTTDVKSYIRSYFKQDKADLAEALISKVESDRNLRELTQNPLNALLLCVIFEDLEGILPSSRTQLYVEIVVVILRRYESKNGLSNRGKDLLLVYKKELMILGRTALYSLRKDELYFDDHKGDIKESLLMKFGFLSIQSGGSKRAPCDRYGFFHKSFQEFFSGYFLAFSIIDDVTTFHSVLTDPRYMGELFQVFKFMSAIIAKQSEETAVSIVQSIASIENATGPASLRFYPKVAHYLINECKTFSGDLYTKLVRIFGESLELVDVVVGYSYDECDKEIFGTILKALAFNATISKLRLLNLQFFSKATSLLAHALKLNTTLSSLDLRDNVIDAEGANSLAQALRVNTSLSSLDLSWNSIGDEGANSLAQALIVNTSLSSLGLTHCSIGDEGANSLAQALRVNTSIPSLNLCGNSIGDEGANSLAQALRVNTSLSSLDLGWNSIGDEGANSLAQALRVNTSIPSLNLCGNSIGDEGANSLAQALRVNTSLSSLDLGRNSIGDEGANSLAQALRVNTSLSSLDLGRNSIGDEGANSLAQALRVNTSILSLNLCGNSIGDEGANSLAQALRVNTSIPSLNLCGNSIGDEGANSLAQALRVNTSILSLNLCGNSIGDEGANSLAQALRVNTSLSSLDLRDNVIDAEVANSLVRPSE
ncbi:uncharacterized protein LOC141879795 isoform X3 [Acropora palmata]|uniref:uncharacterized protein LOC141879795 isoform X3 n=1 Tax=Acropora palmata TaxID=6131 RepID=UPI003DA07543